MDHFVCALDKALKHVINERHDRRDSQMQPLHCIAKINQALNHDRPRYQPQHDNRPFSRFQLHHDIRPSPMSQPHQNDMSHSHEDNRPSPILNSYQHGKPVFRSDISVCPEAEHFSRDQLNIVKPCAPPAAPPANTTAPQLDDNESQRLFERCEHILAALDSHYDVSSELTKTHLRAELATVKRLEAETLLFC